MLVIQGSVFNVFRNKEGVTKEGKAFGGDWKVQLMAKVPAEDGTCKAELVDLKCKDAGPFKSNPNRLVEVPVGVFSPARGQVVFYITGDPVFPGDKSPSKTSPNTHG